MVWLRLDDAFLDNPKIRSLGRDACMLHLAGLLYSAQNLTDGFIPTQALPLVAAKAWVSEDDLPELVDRLLVPPPGNHQAAAWEAVEGGYTIHDFLAFNPPASRVQAKRQADAERQARYRQRQTQPPDPDPGSGSHSVTNASTHAANNAVSPRVPSQPVPAQTRTQSVPVDDVVHARARRALVGLDPRERGMVDDVVERLPEIAEDADQLELLVELVRQMPGVDLRFEARKCRSYFHMRDNWAKTLTDWVLTGRSVRYENGRAGPAADAKVLPFPTVQEYEPSGFPLWDELRAEAVKLNAKHLFPCRQLECWTHEEVEPISLEGNVLTVRPLGDLHPYDREVFEAGMADVARMLGYSISIAVLQEEHDGTVG